MHLGVSARTTGPPNKGRISYGCWARSGQGLMFNDGKEPLETFKYLQKDPELWEALIKRAERVKGAAAQSARLARAARPRRRRQSNARHALARRARGPAICRSAHAVVADPSLHHEAHRRLLGPVDSR